MRPILTTVLLLAGIFLLFQQCTKKIPACCLPDPFPAPVEWRLVQSVGGIAGGVHPVPADSLFLLRLSPPNTYEFLSNGRTIDSGTFKVVDTLFAGRDTVAYEFSHNPTPQVVRWTPDSLYLGQEMTDTEIGIYVVNKQ